MVFINHTEVLDGEVAVVEIDGPLNSDTSPDFEEYIKQLLEKDIRYILFDAKKLEFVSSEGIGVILFIQQKISENNGFFVIFNLSDEIKSLYKVLGFDKIFTAVGSKSEAMQIMDRQIELRNKNIDTDIKEESISGSIIQDKSGKDREKDPETEFEPFIVECATCKSLIRVKKSGDYLCPDCRASFNVMKDQTVIFQ